MTWRSEVPPELQNPYQNEWDVLMQKIRDNEPHNEVESGVYATLTSTMGRYSAHTGQEVTLDQMMNHELELAPQVGDLMYSSD